MTAGSVRRAFDTWTAPAPGRGHELVELEGLRAVAAFAVLLTHAGFLSGATGRDAFPGFLARMDIGVAIFFVLSGFLLWTPHARRLVSNTPAPAVSSYVVRRVARLVPAWLVVLVGTLALVPESRTAPAEVWVANLLQLQSLRLEWDLPGLAQLWSLSAEVMFYVALPIVGVVAARAGRSYGRRGHLAVLGGLVCATWTFRGLDAAGLLADGFSWTRTLPAVGDWFVVGMLLAVVAADGRLRRPATGVVRASSWQLYALAACVFWVLTTRLAGPYDLIPPTSSEATVKHIGYAVVAGLVVAPSVLGGRTVVSRVLSSRPVVYVGTVSYGVFLWHLPLMFAVRSALGLDIFEFGFWSTVLLTSVASVGVAAVSWHVLEKPVQAVARRRTTRSNRSRPPVPRDSERDQEQRQRA